MLLDWSFENAGDTTLPDLAIVVFSLLKLLKRKEKNWQHLLVIPAPSMCLTVQ